MDFATKCRNLASIIDSLLLSLIDRDYYLLEIPYYTNIGDTLIWQGELDMLSKSPHKCKGMYALESFPFWKTIPEGSLILFQGGGNFGDLWTKHHDFKMNIIRKFPKCKFIFFPQTFFFQKRENLLKCASFLSSQSDITICARDEKSFETLKTYFQCNVLLVPDMAFCIDMTKWPASKNAGSKDLFLKRTDGEFKNSQYVEKLTSCTNMDVTDWPTMLGSFDKETKKMHRYKDHFYFRYLFADRYAFEIYRPHLIQTGVDLLASYNKIYTTRLHAAILGVLMNKEIEFLDNSYGKNMSFFETWLYDYDKIKFERK